MNKKPDVVALRAIRKVSHLSNKAAKKGSHFMERVEGKTTRLLINKTGSPIARSNISMNEVIYHSIPEITPVHPALPMLGQKPSITVFAFLDPRGFYGGIATLLCVGAAMANRMGYDLRVAQTTGFSDSTDVLEYLKTKDIIIEENRFSTIDLSKRSTQNYGYLPLHEDDILLVSAWWDAHIASLLPLRRKFIYLIQDYEPIFYNNSDRAVFAEQTYLSENFLPLMNTEILYKFFCSKGYEYITSHGSWFEPAPAPPVSEGHEKSILHYSDTIDKKSRILFLYGRPNVHRNLFFNAIKALDIAFQDEKMGIFNWQIYCAGSADIPNIKLQSGHVIKNLGKMDVVDYYDFARTVDVALSPMLAPHPNYPTLELASLGAMVVTTKWESKKDLSVYSPNIIMADPSAESMAQMIIKASLVSKKARLAKAKNNNIGASWPEALSAPINKLAESYDQNKSKLR